MKISAFPAIRPTEGNETAIASLPYDVMNTEEAFAMAEGKPHSFLHVVRSEIDFPKGTDPHTTPIYAKAAENLAGLITNNLMMREGEAKLYIYRQQMGEHKQTSVVACCDIDDYANNVILRHEKTRKDKEEDRLTHILTTNANTGQVFLTYRDVAAIDAIVAEECAKAPIYDFVAEDGIGHTVWIVEKTKELIAAFEAVPKAYIADGHHRSAASFRAGMEKRKAAGDCYDADAEFNRFMACLFPASQLKLLPYNRCVKDLNGLSTEAFLAKVSEGFKMEKIASPELAGSCTCAMYIDKQWYKLGWTLDKTDSTDPVAQLDVSRLQEDLLAPILGIGDPRTDERIFFVGGIRGNGELVKNVDSGEAAVAFAMYPTTIEQMMAIADAGQTMPPKSTWFEPKLRSGLLVHELGEATHCNV